MIKKIFLLSLLVTSFWAQAQYTNIINSNRPGFSENPYSVGTGIYQFESAIFYKKNQITPTFTVPESFGINVLFRTNFILEKLELNLNTTFQQDKVALKNFIPHYNSTGISAFTIGAKYLLYRPTYTDKSKEIRSWKKRYSFDWKQLIPSVAVYTGLNVGSILTKIHKKNSSFSTKIGVLLQNQITSDFNVITNFYYNYIGSNLPEFSYIITGTYSFTDRWSAFLENQMLSNKYEAQSDLGIGITHLYTPNLQFNASIRSIFQENSNGFYANLGVSYRINKHKDSFIEVDKFGKKVEKEKISNHKKGFFGRLFGTIFKKKKKYSFIEVDKFGKKVEKEKISNHKKGFFGRLFGTIFKKKKK